MSRYLIGIDVGTTGTKSMLFSDSGRIISHAYSEYPCQTPGTGMVEQNAEDWWRAVVKTVRAITADPQTAKNVAAISLSLQGGTFVPVDRQYRPLHPAIVWSDKRCERQRQAFLQAFGPEYVYQKTGWHLGPGLNAMQIAWFRENYPDLFEKTFLFLSVPDYISLRLTGRPVVDISDVGINQLADIRTGHYDKAIRISSAWTSRVCRKSVPRARRWADCSTARRRSWDCPDPYCWYPGPMTSMPRCWGQALPVRAIS